MIFGELLHLQLGNLADTFIQSHLQRLIQTFTHGWQSQPCRTTGSWSGAVRVRCPAQGHRHTQIGGAGDRTINLTVTIQPALPPELSRPVKTKM